MNADTIRRAEAIFQRAVDLPAAQRTELLSAECAHDPPLRRFVEELLRSATSTGGLLDHPPFPLAQPDPHDAGEPAEPARIGPYDVVRLIGQGGMAVVYEARQENPSRTVALKVMRPGFSSRSLIRRFQHEADVLGRLQHPDIAHIYEAALGDVIGHDGSRQRLPYFAMELIHGSPLNRYAERNALTVAQRLELVARVCDAVQYAHQKGVIHRDLKPANILVIDDAGEPTENEPSAAAAGTPRARPAARPKILDFGVARVVAPDMAGATMDTQIGQLVGTLAYMSPEQVSGAVDQIDTRSDVYALGVILYELLSGRLPHEVQEVSLTEAVRRIREEPPPRLATIDRRLRGEIDTIVTRAMQKDRERRYQSPHELAQDIHRHLRGEAIEARRDSAFYVLKKGLWRYRGLVAAAAASVAALAAFALYNAAQAAHFQKLSDSERAAHRAASAAARAAEREAAKARAASEFLKEVIELANPGPAGGYDRTLIDVLDEATQRLARGALKDQPEVEAEVRRTLARTYGNLFLFDPRVVHLNWLLEHYRRSVGEESAEYIDALCGLSGACNELGRPEDGEPYLRRALELARTVFGQDSYEVADILDWLGNSLMRQRRPADALPFGVAAAEAFARLEGESGIRTAEARFNLAGIYRGLARHDEMLALYEQARPALADRADNPIGSVRFRQYYIQDVLERPGRLREAEAAYRETLAIGTRSLGADHPETLATMYRLARCLRAMGRLDEAADLLNTAFETYSRVRGSMTVGEFGMSLELVACLVEGGDFDRAAEVLAVEVERFTRFRSPADAGTLQLLERLAQLEQQRGNHAAAATRYDELVARLADAGKPEDQRVAAWQEAAAKLRRASPSPNEPSP